VLGGKWLKSISRQTIYIGITEGKCGKSIYAGLGHFVQGIPVTEKYRSAA